MILRFFIRKRTLHASYLISCSPSGSHLENVFRTNAKHPRRACSPSPAMETPNAEIMNLEEPSFTTEVMKYRYSLDAPELRELLEGVNLEKFGKLTGTIEVILVTVNVLRGSYDCGGSSSCCAMVARSMFYSKPELSSELS